MTPHEFVEAWSASTLSERAAAQTHFIDLCHLLGVPTPVESDSSGHDYSFERAVQKAARGRGFADVWKRGAFAWEYKGRGGNLGDAYRQLLLYRDDLGNPPLLIVCNIDRIEIHTNFTGSNKAVHVFALADLLDAQKRAELRRAWTDPQAFDPTLRREAITEDATNQLGRIALSLRDRGNDPERVAHFMMQLVFALFAEDTGLLPGNLVSRILERGQNPSRVQSYLSQLFRAMSVGGEVLLEDVEHFNGGLFDGSDALLLTQEEIGILHDSALRDWSEVEPAIFGTLFERSLDPARRSQLGAHYTSRDDILRIVEPVIVEPLRSRWATIRATAEEHLAANHSGNPRTVARHRRVSVDEPVTRFLHELHSLRVLDPACGSGNFLYIALQAVKDLEHEVVSFAEQVGAPGFRLVGPRQFFGIEVNLFARELASMVVWIGYLQWNRANGLSNVQRPILEPLRNITLHDALMNDDGSEYRWPDVDYIIGNPPFLGDRRMRRELGHQYVDSLRSLFRGRLPGSSDFVCYWFEKARAHIEGGHARRAGLIATNSITGGSNAVTVERILQSGGIFAAWRDEPWVLEGAAVRVSIICFDDGSQTAKLLDGAPVTQVTPQLTAETDIRRARRLADNTDLSFVGIQKGGPFDIPSTVADQWALLPNPDGASNTDVLRPYIGGDDVVGHPADRWIVDFAQRTEEDARRFQVPFAHVEANVKPTRLTSRRTAHRQHWWRHHDTRPALRRAISGLTRFIVTPVTSKHRVFVWVEPNVLPSNAAVAIAADDDFTFGVLHSRIHEVWSLALGTRLEDRPRYTPSTSFETFPFPHRGGDAIEHAVSASGAHLSEVRQHLMADNPDLTLTDLYNELDSLRGCPDTAARVYPLLVAHEQLDRVVAEAYGWPWPLADGDILGRVLDLNLERSSLND